MIDWIKSQFSLSLLTSIARQGLTILGGYLISKSWVTPDQAAQITGAGLVLVSIIWSFFGSAVKADALAVKDAVTASPIVDVAKTATGETVIVPIDPANGGRL